MLFGTVLKRVPTVMEKCGRWIANSLTRLTESCSKKCIPGEYREGDLNKGESVCLDRCVGKFFDVNIKVSEKMQGDAASRQGGGMGMGM